jgi:hypothetical protein
LGGASSTSSMVAGVLYSLQIAAFIFITVLLGLKIKSRNLPHLLNDNPHHTPHTPIPCQQ